MLPDKLFGDTNKYRDNEKYIRETTQQVIKDFALFGMDISFPEDMNFAYDELFEQLKHHIARLFDTSNSLLLSLLYQIDVSEKAIHRESTKNPQTSTPELITHLVLEREFKKVITRNYIKENGI